MIIRNPLIKKFLLLTIIILAVAYVSHSFLLQQYGSEANNLWFAYIVNWLLASAIFIGLFRFRKKYKDQLGFLFMSGSLFKFLIFFLVFYPTYLSDGSISTQEFLSFFIPYALCLISETYFLIKMLEGLKE